MHATRARSLLKRAPNANIPPDRPTPRLFLRPPHSLQLPLLLIHQILPPELPAPPLPTVLLGLPLLPRLLAHDLLLLRREDRARELLAAQLPDERRPRRGEERLGPHARVRGDVGQRGEVAAPPAEDEVDGGLGFEEGGELREGGVEGIFW